MEPGEGLRQAELLVTECTKDLAVAQSDHDMRRVEVAVQIAQTFALIAIADKP